MAANVNAEIDLAGIATVEEFHKRIRQGMPVPEYYGDNLDALYDLLSETSGRILFKGAEAVDEDMTEYVDRMRGMCVDAQKGNPMLQIMFV